MVRLISFSEPNTHSIPESYSAEALFDSSPYVDLDHFTLILCASPYVGGGIGHLSRLLPRLSHQVVRGLLSLQHIFSLCCPCRGRTDSRQPKSHIFARPSI